MKEIFVALGVGIATVLALVGVPFLNITIGPSTNTIMQCKALEEEGYLADECFHEDGMLKPDCVPKKPEGTEK